MVEAAVPRHLTVLLADLNADKKTDLIVGNFMRGESPDALDLKIYLNKK